MSRILSINAKQPAFVKILDYDIEPNTGFLFYALTPFKVSLYMYYPSGN